LAQAVTRGAKAGFWAALCIWFFPRSLFLIFLCISVASAQQAPTPAASVDSSVARAEELLRAGRTKDGLAILNQLSASVPNTPHLQARIGKAYFQSNQFQQAIHSLKAALDQDGTDAESMQLLALCYFVLAQYGDALPLLEKLGPRVAGSGPDGPYLLASCYVMTQHYDQARKIYAELLSLAPDSATAYLMFGKFLVRQRLEDRAVPAVQAALQRDPQLAMAHFLLGEIDLYQGEVPAAIEEFRKELAINPTVWLVYWRLGDAYVRLEKYDEAERALKQAVWLNETSSGAYILLGQVALKRSSPEAAATYLERAVQLDARNDYAHYFLGKAYQGLGRADAASQQFTIARQFRNNRRTEEQSASQQAHETAH
jgi:tetratricopeptide (TPR) repeat protein